jgi:hypothetical protein
LDHSFTPDWPFNSSDTYFRRLQALANQLDIRGGQAKSVLSSPNRSDSVSGTVTGQLRPSLLSTVRFGWVRTGTHQTVK